MPPATRYNRSMIEMPQALAPELWATRYRRGKTGTVPDRPISQGGDVRRAWYLRPAYRVLTPSRDWAARKALTRSIGSGKMIVEFFSDAISVSVWR
jgi:hypothetical protein